MEVRKPLTAVALLTNTLAPGQVSFEQPATHSTAEYRLDTAGLAKKYQLPEQLIDLILDRQRVPGTSGYETTDTAGLVRTEGSHDETVETNQPIPVGIDEAIRAFACLPQNDGRIEYSELEPELQEQARQLFEVSGLGKDLYLRHYSKNGPGNGVEPLNPNDEPKITLLDFTIETPCESDDQTGSVGAIASAISRADEPDRGNNDFCSNDQETNEGSAGQRNNPTNAKIKFKLFVENVKWREGDDPGNRFYVIWVDKAVLPKKVEIEDDENPEEFDYSRFNSEIPSGTKTDISEESNKTSPSNDLTKGDRTKQARDVEGRPKTPTTFLVAVWR